MILHLSSGVYFGLDSVGTRMWQLLSEHDSIDKVVEAFLAEYEVEEEKVRNDLDRLVQQLVEKGLLETGTERPPPPV